MEKTQRLLALRKQMKSKKPRFLKQDSFKKKTIRQRWGKPKGLHSKMRHHLRGYNVCVRVGYRTPESVRGLSSNGMREVCVSTFNDLQRMDAQKDICVLSSTLGQRKKVSIVQEAVHRGLSIRNLKNPQKFLDDVKVALQKRKEDKKHQKETKDKKKQEAKKTEVKKESGAASDASNSSKGKKSIEDLTADANLPVNLSQNVSQKAQKDAQKKEQDKILTKREA